MFFLMMLLILYILYSELDVFQQSSFMHDHRSEKSSIAEKKPQDHPTTPHKEEPGRVSLNFRHRQKKESKNREEVQSKDDDDLPLPETEDQVIRAFPDEILHVQAFFPEKLESRYLNPQVFLYDPTQRADQSSQTEIIDVEGAEVRNVPTPLNDVGVQRSIEQSDQMTQMIVDQRHQSYQCSPSQDFAGIQVETETDHAQVQASVCNVDHETQNSPAQEDQEVQVSPKRLFTLSQTHSLSIKPSTREKRDSEMITDDFLSMSVNDSIVFMKPTTTSDLNVESIILEESIEESQHLLRPPEMKIVDLKDWDSDSSESWQEMKVSNSLSSVFEKIEENKSSKVEFPHITRVLDIEDLREEVSASSSWEKLNVPSSQSSKAEILEEEKEEQKIIRFPSLRSLKTLKSESDNEI
jgi:hypothetical protein